MGPEPVLHRCLAPLIVLLLFCCYADAGEMNYWCVASPRATDALLQEGLNYACGQGGADCSAIQPGRSCALPDTVRDHASYAFNDFWQVDPSKRSCDFGGGAMITTDDPSTATCEYPSYKN